jgi:hypothetical protein
MFLLNNFHDRTFSLCFHGNRLKLSYLSGSWLKSKEIRLLLELKYSDIPSHLSLR